MDNQKSHDSFFKETFGKVDVTRSFLEHYLPQDVLASVDIDSLEA